MTRARGVSIGHRVVGKVWFRVRLTDGRTDGRTDDRVCVRAVDENDDDDAICCKRFCKQHDDDFHDDVVEKRAWASGDGTSGDEDARGGELWVSGVFPARGGGTHGTGGG